MDTMTKMTSQHFASGVIWGRIINSPEVSYRAAFKSRLPQLRAPDPMVRRYFFPSTFRHGARLLPHLPPISFDARSKQVP
jgi:hypothetical protein